MINVTKTYLPPLDEYVEYLQKIWKSGFVTNRSPFVLELEQKIKTYLGVKNMLFVNNGTIALQIAIKSLDLQGEIITTPFSYVATTTAILWENCEPVFVDIEPDTFCIDAHKIEASITSKTSAILATHVYGYPCNVIKIAEIAKKYKLKVIYDAAHAFGIEVEGQSIFNFGDISTTSFHATKLFHTIEGGGIFCNDDELFRKITLAHQFGHFHDDYYQVGVNGKVSEFHAAMGLCNLERIHDFITTRNKLIAMYDKQLAFLPIQRPKINSDFKYNGAYYPVVFESEEVLLAVKHALNQEQIFPRRYFYPSLNTVPYLKKQQPCEISEDIAKKVLCLPLFYELELSEIEKITHIINQTLC